MKCVNCGNETQAGKPYRFYYGKQGETDFPTHKTTRTRYAIGGWEDAFLCDPCVDKKIDTRARNTALAVFILTLSMALLRLALDAYVPQGAPLEKVIGFPMAFFFGLLIYKGIQSWKKGKQREDEGQRLAIMARKPALRGQGYNAFFTLSEFSRLG
jgi:hypothetical protein